MNALDKLTLLFKKYFPNKVIYPTLGNRIQILSSQKLKNNIKIFYGNHEASPVNLYPTPATKDDNIEWLYSELAIDWIETGLPSYLSSNITRF